jgi:hypothetical protein
MDCDYPVLQVGLNGAAAGALLHAVGQRAVRLKLRSFFHYAVFLQSGNLGSRQPEP